MFDRDTCGFRQFRYEGHFHLCIILGHFRLICKYKGNFVLPPYFWGNLINFPKIFARNIINSFLIKIKKKGIFFQKCLLISFFLYLSNRVLFVVFFGSNKSTGLSIFLFPDTSALDVYTTVNSAAHENKISPHCSLYNVTACNTSSLLTTNQLSTFNLWHNKLGHPNAKVVPKSLIYLLYTLQLPLCALLVSLVNYSRALILPLPLELQNHLSLFILTFGALHRLYHLEDIDTISISLITIQASGGFFHLSSSQKPNMFLSSFIV